MIHVSQGARTHRHARTHTFLSPLAWLVWLPSVRWRMWRTRWDDNQKFPFTPLLSSSSVWGASALSSARAAVHSGSTSHPNQSRGARDSAEIRDHHRSTWRTRRTHILSGFYRPQRVQASHIRSGSLIKKNVQSEPYPLDIMILNIIFHFAAVQHHP